MQLLATAAKKPIVLKEASLHEQSTSPPTTGTSARFTGSEVYSLSISRAKITVKNGAEDLTVSVKETATYFRETCGEVASGGGRIEGRNKLTDVL